jgi:YidC/Oxa1 family membrane protein insertase
MEERRLILAIALSLVVLTAWRYLVAPPEPGPRRAEVAAEARPATPPTAAKTLPGPPPASPAAVLPVSDARERRVEVETADVAVAFTNRGARAVSWRLKRFTDAKGRPEEMVEALAVAVRPMDLETGDSAVDARLREALFQPSTERLEVSSLPASLDFRFAEGELDARKVLRFEARGYLVSAAATVTLSGRSLPVRLLWGPGIGNPSPEEKQVQGYHDPQAVALGRGGVERIAADKLGGGRALADVAWAGVESQYFAALFVPPGGRGPAEVRALPVPPEVRARPGVVAGVAFGPEAQPGLLYVGPKDHQGLVRVGHGLEQVVPVGEWIGPIVVVLMRMLRFVHDQVGNYGWSIVLLTLLINLVLAPLRHYSIANGIKMAKLAPEMKVIQDRYRGIPALDKRREQMQREMAALYAKHGMSMGTQMAVGCLPLLLTMPFLFAFYRVLQVSIELRGAPYLWIPDLAQKDPLYLTPLLMGASMLLMQKMTPSAMDPGQQRMMMLMPLMFMVMFFAAPAGLNLYWLASNVCAIAQQAVTLRLVHGAPARAARRRT